MMTFASRAPPDQKASSVLISVLLHSKPKQHTVLLCPELKPALVLVGHFNVFRGYPLQYIMYLTLCDVEYSRVSFWHKPEMSVSG
jgi:hypothetical protein